MGSSFKGQNLFGSGAHRFVLGRLGRRIVSESTIVFDPGTPGSSEWGDLELRIEVRGRLVATGTSALWSLRDSIIAQADSTVASGTLIDGNNRSWSDVKLITYEESGATRRGRKVSVAYTAVFGQLTAP